MLRTLRLRFADRPEYELAYEQVDEENDPWALLRRQADEEGKISLGDRDSCRIEEVLDVTVAIPEPSEGPTWERGLQDEDAATALEENYDPPTDIRLLNRRLIHPASDWRILKKGSSVADWAQGWRRGAPSSAATPGSPFWVRVAPVIVVNNGRHGPQPRKPRRIPDRVAGSVGAGVPPSAPLDPRGREAHEAGSRSRSQRTGCRWASLNTLARPTRRWCSSCWW